MDKWSLINYFDVWGNEEDGWEVNDQCIEFDDLCITDDATDQEILDYLKEIEFLKTSDKKLVNLSYGFDRIEIETINCYPLGALVRNVI